MYVVIIMQYLCDPTDSDNRRNCITTCEIDAEGEYRLFKRFQYDIYLSYSSFVQAR